jgi:hypothetical protein
LVQAKANQITKPLKEIMAHTPVAEALRSELHNLEESVTSLLELIKSLPEGEIRNKFLDEVSALDFIADVIRQALDSTK